MRYSILESLGYFVSVISVILLAIAAWSGAEGNPALRTVIIAGSSLAALGMMVRWYVYWHKHGRKGQKR